MKQTEIRIARIVGPQTLEIPTQSKIIKGATDFMLQNSFKMDKVIKCLMSIFCLLICSEIEIQHKKNSAMIDTSFKSD